MFFGATNPKYEGIADINARELFTLVPLAIIILFLGIWPHPVLNLMNTSMSYLGDIIRSVTPL